MKKIIKISVLYIVFISCEKKEVSNVNSKVIQASAVCDEAIDKHCNLNNSPTSCTQILGAKWSEDNMQCIHPNSLSDCQKTQADYVWNGHSCENKSKALNFYRYCIAPTVTQEMANTLNVIRKNYNKSSCQVVFSILHKKKKLDLSSEGISDITLLYGLNNLEELILFKNKISDINILQYLKKLKILDLGSNQISDIRSLKKIKTLEELYLQENSISDPSPLNSLKKLKILNLEKNKISDFSSLDSLNLGANLYTSGNNIVTQEQIDQLIKEKDPNRI